MNEKRMQVVGLCGRSGSGKGYVCRVFEKMGVPSIDTDAVYKSLLVGQEGAPSPCLSAIVRAFGNGVLDADGNLNRRALAKIVFAPGSGARLEQLNSITHKYIKEHTQREIALLQEAGASAVLIDAPVLFESGFDALCDLTFYVRAPLPLLVQRICARDGITEEEARRRLDVQMSDSALAARCDGVILNDGIADVNEQVAEIIQRFSLLK